MSQSHLNEGGSTPGLPARVWGLAHALWTDSIARRRAWILIAGTLVCLYSVAVLTYVLTLPEIGIRCAFTPVVNFVYPDFLYPTGQKAPLKQGDRIVKLGDQKVETWSQLLRKMLLLRDEAPETDDVTLEELRKGTVHKSLTHVQIDGQRVVRVEYKREGEDKNQVVWYRLGRSPFEALLPGVLWFCLNIGLFVVGAIVFWKRPEDA